MKYCLIVPFVLASLVYAYSQDSTATDDVSTLFELKVDSIELKITNEKWGTDSSYYLHYTVKNRSEDTLVYTTNSCFYYNHYVLKTEHSSFDINPSGGCNFNALTPFTLPPGASCSRTEWITAQDLHPLVAGDLDVTLSVPLVRQDKRTYRVDGRDFVKDAEPLIFTGKTIFIKTVVDKRKRKKKV